MLTDGRRTDAGVTSILLAHPLAFGSGKLINSCKLYNLFLHAYYMRSVAIQYNTCICGF